MHPFLQKDTPLIKAVRERTSVSSIAVQLAAGESLIARDTARHIPQRVLQLCVDGVVVILAVVIAAGVAQVVRVAEAAVGDTCVVAFLFLSCRTPHRTIDTLTLPVDWDLMIVCRREVGRAVLLGGGGDASAGVGGGF